MGDAGRECVRTIQMKRDCITQVENFRLKVTVLGWFAPSSDHG